MKNRLRKELEAMLGLHTGDSFTANNVHTLVNGIFAADEGGGFEYVEYDNNAFPYPQTIGRTANSIVGLGNANESMIDTIFIMPNKSTNPDATMMIVVDEKEPSTDPKTYQYVYVGNINDLPSDVLTEGSIINDLSTGGTNKPLSAEQGRTLNSHVNYTTCGSGASDQVKLISDDGFELSTHLRLLVRMTNTNTNSTPKFNINNTGVKDVWYNGSIASDTNTWSAGEVLDVYYDGINYVATPYLNVDDEPTAESDNLVKSGGVYNINQISNKNLLWQLAGSFCKEKIDFNSSSDGFIAKSAAYRVLYIKCKKDKLIRITGHNGEGIKIAYSSEIPTTNGSCNLLRSFNTDCDVVINPDNDGYICVNIYYFTGASSYIYIYNIVDNSSTYIPHVKKFEYISNAGIVVNSDLETYGSVQLSVGTPSLKCSTDYIPIDGYSYIGARIVYSTSSFTVVGNNTNFGICFYDNEYNVIDSTPTFVFTGDGHSSSSISLIRVPKNSAYFKWTLYTSSNSIELMFFDRANDGIHLDEALNLIKTEGVNYLGITSKVIDYTTQEGGILASGKFSISSEYTHAVIPVTQGDIFFIVSEASSLRFAFATSDISSLGGDIPMVEGTEVIVPPVNEYTKIIIPEGCNYLLYNDYAGKLFKYYENISEFISKDKTHLVNPTEESLALATDAMQLKAKLEGITATETKVIETPISGYFVRGTDGSIGITTAMGAYIETVLGDAKSVRFLGALYTSTSYTGGYAFGHYTDPSDSTTWITDLSSVFDTNAGARGTREYIVKCPEESTHFRTTIATSTVPELALNFYCYLRTGDTVRGEIDYAMETVVEQSTTGKDKLPLTNAYGYYTRNGYFLKSDGTISSQSSSNYRCVFTARAVNKGAILDLAGETTSPRVVRVGISSTEVTPDNFSSLTYEVLYDNNVNEVFSEKFTIPYDGWIIYYRYVNDAWVSGPSIYVYNSLYYSNDGAFDVSKYKNNKTYTSVSDAIADIPSTLWKGGMEIKYEHFIPASYSLLKTTSVTELPVGTEVLEDLGLSTGIYTKSQLTNIETLPSSSGSSETYYMVVIGETTTYTTWVITKESEETTMYKNYILRSPEYNMVLQNWDEVSSTDDVIELLKTESNKLVACTDYVVASRGISASEIFGSDGSHGILYVHEGEKYLIVNDSKINNNIGYAFVTRPTYTNGGTVPVIGGTTVYTVNSSCYHLITIPKNCNYLIFNCPPYPFQSVYPYYLSNIYRVNNVDNTPKLNSNALISSAGVYEELDNLYGHKSNYFSGLRLNESGSASTYPGYGTSNYIACNDKKYCVTYNVYIICFYDSGYTLISRSASTVPPIPSNAAFLRYSFLLSDKNSNNVALHLEDKVIIPLDEKIGNTELARIRYVGDGNNTVSSNRVYEVCPNHKYRLIVKNPDADISEVTYTTSGYSRFVIGYNNGNLVTIGMNTYENPLNNSYTFTLPNDAEYIYVSGRCNTGVEMSFVLEDISSTFELFLYDEISFDNRTLYNYWIDTSTGKYATSPNYKHYLLNITNVKSVRITANSSKSTQYAWFTEMDTPTSGGTPPILDRAVHFISADTSDDIMVPSGARFLYIYYATSGSVLPSYLGFYTGTDDKDEFDDDFNERRDRQIADLTAIGLTNLNPPLDSDRWELPQTLQQLNALKKSEQLINIRWTPKWNVPSKNDPYYFASGTTVTTGIPYSSNNDDGTKKVGVELSLHTFMTAINNPYSLIYTECINNQTKHQNPPQKSGWGKVYTESGNGYAYYGTVCCGLTSSVENSPMVWNNPVIRNYNRANGIYVPICPMGTVNFNLLKIGDVCDDTAHSFLIYGLHRDSNGEIDQVKIAESTSGYGKGGCRIRTRTREQFISEISTGHNPPYTIFRYVKLWDNTDYEPSEYVPLTARGEQENTVTYNDAICTFAGDKATFRETDLVVINYNLNGTQPYEWTKIVVYKDDVLLGEYTLSEAEQTLVDFYLNGGTPDNPHPVTPDPFNTEIDQHNHALVLGKTLASGKYKAQMSDNNGNVSDFTYWEVLPNLVTVVANNPDNYTVTVGGTEEIQVVYINGMYYLPTFEEQQSRKFTVHPLSLAQKWAYTYATFGIKFKIKGIYGNITTLPTDLSGAFVPEEDPDDPD